MAITGPPSGLSPRLAELAKPAVRSSSHAAQAARLGLAREAPGSLLREGNRVLVYVRFDHGAAAGVDALRAAGAEISDASRRYQTVTAAIRPVDLTGVAAVPGVAGVTEALAPVAAASSCPAGTVVSEGVEQLNAGESPGEARDEFSVDGEGVTVGILSDSFDQATEAADGSGPIETTATDDAKSGDLPGTGNTCSGQGTPVSVLEADKPELGEEPADEGRAMAQIVHDIAPGANLDFASAFNGEASFAKNIEKLATAGAKVIADDVFYLEEPFFQDGPVAVAVNKVVNGGATFLSAAGNDNLFDPEGHEIASWETPEYRDSGACPVEVEAIKGANTNHCLDFNPGSQTDRTFGVKVAPGGDLTVDLQWDEPWNGVETDLDAYLLDANGRLIAPSTSAEDNIGISQKPLEVVQWENESSSQRTVQLVINRFSGESPRLKFGLLENGFGVAATEYPRSTGEDVVGPTIFGHSGTAKAISVGAVPFDDSEEPERYSSRGPVRHDFGPVAGSKAAAPIAEEIVAKPDVVATDCGRTTFFASFEAGGWHFCGTSAAAPHAAGVAALMLEDDSAATPNEIQTALQDGADAVGAFGPCAVGAGLVEAVGAIEALPSPPPFAPAEKCATPEPEGSVEEAQAPGNWGLETPPPSPPVTQAPEPVKPSLAAPRTFIRSHPAKLIRTRARTVAVVFRFGSDESGVTFACRIDGGLFRSCPQRLVRRFGTGPHTLRVVAFDAGGNGDRTPAVYHFRVKRIS